MSNFINIPIYILKYYNTTILSSRNDTDPTEYPKFYSILILPKGSTRSYIKFHSILKLRSYDTMTSVINEILNDSIMIKYYLKLRGVEIIQQIIAFNLCNILQNRT